MKKYQIIFPAVLLLIFCHNALSQSKRKRTPKVPAALVQQFIDDEDLGSFIDDAYDGNRNRFIKQLEIRQIDLNRDGQVEYFLEAGTLSCGSGGCTTYIYQKVGKNRYRLLFEGGDLDPKNTYTNGYRDLKGWNQFGAHNWFISTYKFNGNEYNSTGCVEFQRNSRGKVTQKSCN